MPGPTIPAPKFPIGVTRAMAAYAAMNAVWSAYRFFTQPIEGTSAAALASNIDVTKTRKLLNEAGYRPKEWASIPRPLSLIDSESNIYVFDAIMRLEHNTSLRITEHPVQSGANIADHSFQLPERLTFTVGMSDAMDSFFTEAQNGKVVEGEVQNSYAVRWADGDNKSYSAYQILKSLQYSKLPLTVVTRLNYYTNMVIENVVAPDDFKTLSGLRATVTMKQIFTANVNNKTVKVSKYPHKTNQTNMGTVASKDSGSALAQFESQIGIQ